MPFNCQRDSALPLGSNTKTWNASVFFSFQPQCFFLYAMIDMRHSDIILHQPVTRTSNLLLPFLLFRFLFALNNLGHLSHDAYWM